MIDSKDNSRILTAIKGIRKEKHRFLSLIVLIVYAVAIIKSPLVYAESDIENAVQYENCSVFERVDLFTDARSVAIGCGDFGTAREAYIAILLSEDGKYMLMFSAGRQYDNETKAEVKYRFDKENVYTETMLNTNGVVSKIANVSEVLKIVVNIANSDKLILKVGQKSSQILLGDATDAVDDFATRINMMFPTHNSDGDFIQIKSLE